MDMAGAVILVWALVILAAIVLDEIQAHRSGLGYEHMHTATAACQSGRHWNCSGRVINFRGGCDCSCPHHKDE